LPADHVSSIIQILTRRPCVASHESSAKCLDETTYRRS
jgi:hypothetical protein